MSSKDTEVGEEGGDTVPAHQGVAGPQVAAVDPAPPPATPPAYASATAQAPTAETQKEEEVATAAPPPTVTAAPPAVTAPTTITAAPTPKEDSKAQVEKSNEGSDGEESEEDEENEVLEESPCGRWRKLRSKVSYRDVPGIDCAYLAMDTEEGVEVVWNEATFSETKKFKAQEDKLKNVFEALTLIEHPNIVKFHRYWTDQCKTEEKSAEKPKSRVILITEFMSSGSLKKFLRKTKKFNRKIPLQSWKRWCTQILSALSYLHSCKPPIIHGNLTCDTIFIQHNGLVKIGSVAPDAIHKNVKTFRENMKNFHFLAPEWTEDNVALTPAIDIFAFGMCALETTALELTAGEEGTKFKISQEAIEKSIESLPDELMKDFIRKCLLEDPSKRPNARELLFHPVLFEVHSLKLLAAHTLVKNPGSLNDSMTDEAIHRYYGNNAIMATLNNEEENEGKCYRLSDFPVHEKLEKFMEDVKFGIYPLTAFALAQPQPTKTRAPSPESHKSDKSCSPEPQDVENRRIMTMQCSIKRNQDKKDTKDISIRILLRMEDNMNRQLSCNICSAVDTAVGLAAELVLYGFIHPQDSKAIVDMMAKAMIEYENQTEFPDNTKQEDFRPYICA